MRACVNCGKAFQMGGTRRLLRGKYNPTAWTKKKANLQWTRTLVPGKRVLACTKCIRTVTKKPHTAKKKAAPTAKKETSTK